MPAAPKPAAPTDPAGSPPPRGTKKGASAAPKPALPLGSAKAKRDASPSQRGKPKAQPKATPRSKSKKTKSSSKAKEPLAATTEEPAAEDEFASLSAPGRVSHRRSHADPQPGAEKAAHVPVLGATAEEPADAACAQCGAPPVVDLATIDLDMGQASGAPAAPASDHPTTPTSRSASTVPPTTPTDRSASSDEPAAEADDEPAAGGRGAPADAASQALVRVRLLPGDDQGTIAAKIVPCSTRE